LAVITVTTGLATAKSYAFADDGGEVLPSDATPHGYSLRDMAKAIALFTTSGNNSQYYPDTPFQILAEDTSTVIVTPSDGGIDVTGGNSFTVGAGTPFFVPVVYVDDSPPVIGTFPANEHAARKYVFDPKQFGANDLAIIVDGKRPGLHKAYVAGPVLTAPLLDGGGTHFISVGAFLTPLRVGTHTVTITTSGEAFVAATGLNFETATFTYTVNVVKGH
jgi:hypothetical protein